MRGQGLTKWVTRGIDLDMLPRRPVTLFPALREALTRAIELKKLEKAAYKKAEDAYRDSPEFWYSEDGMALCQEIDTPLREFLCSQPPSIIQGILAVMYVGRDPEGDDFYGWYKYAGRVYSVSGPIGTSDYMQEKSPLDEYLLRGWTHLGGTPRSNW